MDMTFRGALFGEFKPDSCQRFDTFCRRDGSARNLQVV